MVQWYIEDTVEYVDKDKDKDLVMQICENTLCDRRELSK